MKLLYTPEALNERDDAFFPEAFRARANGRRHAPMRTFPYTVVYTVEPAAVVIVAVFHASRSPGDWEG